MEGQSGLGAQVRVREGEEAPKGRNRQIIELGLGLAGGWSRGPRLPQRRNEPPLLGASLHPTTTTLDLSGLNTPLHRHDAAVAFRSPVLSLVLGHSRPCCGRMGVY